MEQMTRWSSQPTIQYKEGSDEINPDIWNKSLHVRGLTEWATSFLLETAGKHDDAKTVYKVLARAVKDYTKTFGINAAVLLLMYKDVIDSKNAPLYRKIESEWDKIPTENIATARLMAHITTNCVTKMDLVVYRGFKDRRGYQMRHRTFETVKNDLLKMQALNNAEKELDVILKEVHSRDRQPDMRMFEIGNMARKPGDAKSEDPITRANFLAHFIKEGTNEFDFFTRDVSSLTRIGDLVQTETFMSTSLSIEVARQFGGTMLEIQIPKGSPALYISPFSYIKHEKSELEVVIPPCARLIVIGITRGLIRIRYDGISDVAKERMTLSTPQMKTLTDMVETLVARKEIQEKAAIAEREIRNNIGLVRICKSLPKPAMREEPLVSYTSALANLGK